jgi:prevent-host-death family protein
MNSHTNKTAEQHSITAARSKLSRLIRKAESGKTVELTRRGEVVALLIGRKEYERLTSPPLRFSEAWKVFSSQAALEDLNIDPDEVFGDIRKSAQRR